ncbi:hypothetical protein VF04_04480 [Nostoc linckia z7]|uniref:Uncharacterized protein n=2 Tax=Nostoc linckia TaxID=92942 RepID=A0A9Q6EN03_NOSLI|nr:hypothetical protein [Nostoc linckia]PHK42965.1 hypothetical protein VF12_01180 [Nostoc linckia z15]PHK48122.1 hypothetical protein VF13_02155 [Nostoc linckia z16]PHJ65042.1 hypothetical protein VF02_11965 [Nostoc linckia z1]PHJ70083.1 hypothetical protein VF05_11360 [Nostoc linckia z3]PHJ75121.1 hypothetical protein VF03_12285 [Nostoc linckia z2]
MNKYKTDLPHPFPQRILSLPVQNGFPVPWFVAEVNGKYDFRIMDGAKLKRAVNLKRCWICGERLGSHLAFPIGPMCAINRTISEPPSHTECAEWSIKACPFLAQKQEVRRETHLPDNIKEPGGIAIARQPGVTCLWITKSYKVINAGNGVVFKIGNPLKVEWFREGRQATREEVLESIDSGYPILMDMAIKEGKQSVNRLETMRLEALKLLPEEKAEGRGQK